MNIDIHNIQRKSLISPSLHGTHLFAHSHLRINEDTIIKCEINCESLSHFLQGKGGGRPFLNIVNIHVHQCQNWRTLVTWPLKKWSREKPERNQSLPTNFIHVVRVLVCENTDWKHATQWSGDSRYLDMQIVDMAGTCCLFLVEYSGMLNVSFARMWAALCRGGWPVAGP